MTSINTSHSIRQRRVYLLHKIFEEQIHSTYQTFIYFTNSNDSEIFLTIMMEITITITNKAHKE